MNNETEPRFNRTNRPVSMMGMMGKIPPQAVEIENGILGTIIDDSDYLIDVVDTLKPQHFYQEANKKVMEAIISLYNETQPIDILTVTDKMRQLGTLEIAGGGYYITNLTTNAVRAGSNIEYHCKIIEQKYMQREMIRISTETINDAYSDDTDVFDLIEVNQNKVFLTLSETHSKNGDDIKSLLKRSLDELKKPPVHGLTGVGTDFTDLDALTGGWQPQDLIIIAARPAMGKTAFVLACARNATVKFRKPTVVFSLEMSSIQLTNRLVSNETGIHLERILKRRVNEKEQTDIEEKITDLSNSDLIIDDTPSLNVFELRAKCRRLKKKRDIGLIIVDYLQLMQGGEKASNNRDSEIGVISRALKSIAKELDVPVIALSQLSRKLEERQNKRPMLSDLRESGNIEQDADMVLFLHRPEYYGIMHDGKGGSTVGLCEVIVAKHRNGVTDTILLDFNGSLMRFKNRYRPDPKNKKDKPVQAEMIIHEKVVDYSAKQTDEDDEPPF